MKHAFRHLLTDFLSALLFLAAYIATGNVAAGADRADAVGFEQIAVPDPEGQPIAVDLWYPSDAPTAPLRLGPYEQTVAVDGPIAGSNLPLTLISHGTGGSALTHYDTAIALAEAGYITAAVEYTGDNWHDRSYSFTLRNFTERPRQLKLAIDYLLADWAGRDHIAAEKIGAFGHSVGGVYGPGRDRRHARFGPGSHVLQRAPGGLELRASACRCIRHSVQDDIGPGLDPGLAHQSRGRRGYRPRPHLHPCRACRCHGTGAAVAGGER